MSKTITPPYHRWAVWLILGLLVFRLVALFISPFYLHGDEAQYWAWSKDLDWGYFTKPPMIAWVIAATTGIFGDAEWAVRLSSPILHSATAYVIFRTARFAFDAQTGFWAALIYIIMPAVGLSAGIVSTDVPLLFCFAVALNAWLHLRKTPTWPRALQLGLAIGIGLLCKYAMLFFLPALGLAALFDKPTRTALLSLKGGAVVIIAALLIAPNIVWNMNHDFATLSHTVANANVQGGIPFHPGELLTFWADQLIVFGPVTLVLLVMALIAACRQKLESPAFWIALFVLSPLLIISFQALMSRANANWAVTAYVGGSILLAHYGLRTVRKATKAGLIVNAALGGGLVILGLFPALANAVGAANSFKRLRAWPETVEVLENRFAEGHEGQAYSVIALDNRITFYDLNYYGLADSAPLKMWRLKNHPLNHAELMHPLEAEEGPMLLINYHKNYEDEFLEDFERIVPLKPLDIDLGGGKRRKLALWAAYGYTPTETR